MSKRKKGSRAKKKSGTTKKRTSHKRRKAATAAAPAPKTRKRSGRRKASASTGHKRTGGKRRSGRRKAKPAGKFHKWSKVSAHRRRTHNPGSALIEAGIAAGAGVLAYLVTLAATYYVTKDSAQQARNRKIVGGVIIGIAALVVAKKRPLIAAGLAAGGALAVIGDYATLKMMQYLPQKSAPTVSAVYAQNMRGLHQIGAVYAQNMQGLHQIGDAVPAAPWTQPGPFG